MTNTNLSRERREAVAERLACYFEDYDQWPAQDREDVANEIIAAALPDRTVFTVLLDNIMVWSRAVGADATDEVAAMLRDAGIERLFALVYADDAQAGDQEGAEHDGVE